MRTKIEYRQASKETWKRFCDANPDIKITYLAFQKIIYGFNYAFRDDTIQTGKKNKLLYGFGVFVVEKYKRRKTKILPDGTEVFNLSVDWKKTRELGKYVYHLNRHTDGNSLRWRWFPRSAKFKMSEVWSFKPSRISSRLIKHYLLQDTNQQNKYFNWTPIN
jgi:hypothetical protein